MTSFSLPSFPLFKNALSYAKQSNQPIAIDDVRTGKAHSYSDLVLAVATLRERLLDGKRYTILTILFRPNISHSLN